MDRKRLTVLAAIGAVITLSIAVYASQAAQLGIGQPTPLAIEETSSPLDVKPPVTPVMEAEASEKEAWEVLGLPYDPNEGETEEANQAISEEDERSEAIERELARIDAKERATYEMVLSDDRIKTEIGNALDITTDFVPHEGRQTDVDMMNLTVTGREIIEGSWETEYTSTLTDRFVLEIKVKEGSIVSIEKTALADVITVFAKTDEDKQVIRRALENPAIQAALEQKEGLQTTISVYTLISNPPLNCPAGECALITLRVVNSHATFAALMNTVNGEVVQTNALDGW